MRRQEEQVTIAWRAAYAFLRRFRDAFTRNEREDLAQDVALTLLRDPRRVREPARIAAYSRTVARRLRCRRIERLLRLRTVPLLQADEPAAPRGPAMLTIAGGLRLPRWEVFDLLEQALDELSPLNGYLVRARYEGFCCAELAARYGLPIEGVKRRLFRARARVRRRLVGWIEERLEASAPGMGLGATSWNGGLQA